MLKVTRNGKRRGWMVQLDIRSFFMSIDKDILFGMFERSLLKRLGGSEIPAMSAPADRLGFENRVGLPPGNGISASSKSSATDDPNAWVLLYLLHRIIYHHCERDFVFRGDPAMLDKVPPHKSLLKVGEGKGLPIGNLTSQFFANVYLNELDHFIKHELRCRHYVRYVDDFVLLAESPAILEQWVLQLTDFLEKRLLLTLKDGWRVKPVSEGADFLGYIVRPKYILVRNRVVHAMKDKLAGYHRKMVECLKDATGRTILKMKMGPEGTDELMQTLASYLGHFQHADSYNLKRTVFLGHPWLNEYFFFDGKRLFRRLRYPGVFRSFRAQVGFFRAMLKNTVLLVQVGLFMELYDDDAVSAGKALGLAVQKEKRRMAFSAGFPLRYERSTVEKLLALGREVAVIREDGAGKYVKERYVDDLYRIL